MYLRGLLLHTLDTTSNTTSDTTKLRSNESDDEQKLLVYFSFCVSYTQELTVFINVKQPTMSYVPSCFVLCKLHFLYQIDCHRKIKLKIINMTQMKIKWQLVLRRVYICTTITEDNETSCNLLSCLPEKVLWIIFLLEFFYSSHNLFHIHANANFMNRKFY